MGARGEEQTVGESREISGVRHVELTIWSVENPQQPEDCEAQQDSAPSRKPDRGQTALIFIIRSRQATHRRFAALSDSDRNAPAVVELGMKALSTLSLRGAESAKERAAMARRWDGRGHAGSNQGLPSIESP